jgi:pimeloyl-ACP methyl ester carboxylesterase
LADKVTGIANKERMLKSRKYRWKESDSKKTLVSLILKKMYLKHICFLALFPLTASGACMGSDSIKPQNVPARFEESSVKIEGETFRLYKGTFKVKLDRSGNNSAFLDLPIRIIKSNNPSPADPVFWLAGGPGISNLKQKPGKAILSNHDFVSIGYRGVDGPVNLNSKKISRAIKGVNDQLLGKESLSGIQNSIDQYLQELNQKGIDLNNFTIIDVIDDLEDIRLQLGYEKINLLSASYGTRLALLYGYRHPKSIRRSVMVGVNPPGHFIWDPKKTGEILRTYDELFRTQTPDSTLSLSESIRKALQDLPEKWTCFKLDRDKIKAASFVMLYRKKSAILVFDSFRRAATQKDYSGLYLLQLAYDYLVPGMFAWGDLFNKGAGADWDPDRDYRRLLETDRDQIGAPLSLLTWGAAGKWPLFRLEEVYRKVHFDSTETLMIGGNLDISTPPDYAAKELLPYMPGARQIIMENMAHVDDLMYLQKKAFDHLVAGFFKKGTVDSSLFSKEVVNFKPAVSLNTLAKLLYPLIFFLSWF